MMKRVWVQVSGALYCPMLSRAKATLWKRIAQRGRSSTTHGKGACRAARHTEEEGSRQRQRQRQRQEDGRSVAHHGPQWVTGRMRSCLSCFVTCPARVMPRSTRPFVT